MPVIFLTNLRSISNKFDDLKCQLFSLNPDIAICSETWLTSASPVEAFQIPGHSCFRADRSDDSGYGGVAIWCKTSLKAMQLFFPQIDGIELCCVHIPVSRLIVIGLYLPPGISAPNFQAFCASFCDTVDSILTSYPHHRPITAGDFNRYDQSFLTSKFSLLNIVTGATRLSALLDKIFVDPCIFDCYPAENIEIGPPIGRSDHNCVIARLVVPTTSVTSGNAVFTTSDCLMYWPLSKPSFKAICGHSTPIRILTESVNFFTTSFLMQ